MIFRFGSFDLNTRLLELRSKYYIAGRRPSRRSNGLFEAIEQRCPAECADNRSRLLAWFPAKDKRRISVHTSKRRHNASAPPFEPSGRQVRWRHQDPGAHRYLICS